MSLFSAEASGPDIADLCGVLCGQGQVTGFARTAARLTVEVDEVWRARVLAAEFGRRGVSGELGRTEDGRPMIRTAFRSDLIGLANAWLDGSGKTLPGRFRLTGAALRLCKSAARSCGVLLPAVRKAWRRRSNCCGRSWTSRWLWPGVPI